VNLARYAAIAIAVVIFSLASATQAQTSRLTSAEAAVLSRNGWPTASAAETGLSQAKLDAMASDIRTGKFVKIGSVLIARHGKLVYEGYFDGDAASLRDTRSATKSITDALVGIAIDDHKLSGVDARVLALLPSGRKSSRIPIREKRQSRSRIF
jgi:CubicO group peptidase (beta-lactamase class C family)